MTTEYFDAANSLCSDSFESIKRSRLISDEYKNSDFDCENQMDYSGDNFQSEVSAKASSSSIHESITNMSNSHSTPEDTFSEITLSSPSSKHCKPDSYIKDYEQSTDQYLSASSVNMSINQTSTEPVKPSQTASNNLKSIDDTIELVLSKIREENNFSNNAYDISDKSDTSNFLHSNEISNCASNINVLTNNQLSSVSCVPPLGSESHESDNVSSYSKGITSNVSCHNSNIVNYGLPNYNNKTYPQQFYKYNNNNNYGIPSQMAANQFSNQINPPNYSEFNKIDYSRSNYPKEYDKNKYNFYPYQCQNPQFRQYLPNSYLNQPFYKPDPQAVPLHNANYQLLQKSLKRNAYFNQMYIEDDVNHLYKDNSKTQNYNTYFKTPQSNASGGLLDPANSIRKKRTNSSDSGKLTPSKKRKVANQFSTANNIDEIMRKLKVSTYNSLLMSPTVCQSVAVLSPKGFVESNSSNSKSVSLKKSLRYKKYRSTLYRIKKPPVFPDFTEQDRYLSRYIDENMTANSNALLSHKKSFDSDEMFSDIICSSPSAVGVCNDTDLHHLTIDDVDFDRRSPELQNSFTNNHNHNRTNIESMKQINTDQIAPKSTLINGLKNHYITPIVSYSDHETKLITELHSMKSPDFNRNYIQLSGSFLKRTKINGKSFSNIHIEEAVSVASLSASKNQNSCHFCYVFLNGLSAIRKSGKLFGMDTNHDDLLFCSSSCYSNFKSCNSFDCNPDKKSSNNNGNHSNSSNSAFDATNNFQCTKVLIKTTPYKPPKNYKKVCDFEQYVRRRFPSEGQSDSTSKPALPIDESTATTIKKKRLLGVKYCYFKNEPQQSIYREIEKTDQHALLKKYSCSYCADDLIDHRSCLLCHTIGDGNEDVCGRLMNIDADNWIHLNCALWCFEVYETVSGSLMEVQSSLQRASKTVCSFCHTSGAGIQCYRSKCASVYHVPCAHRVGCIFYTDRGMYCPNHVVLNHPMHLPSLRVDRRVTVHRDESALIAAGIVAEEIDREDRDITNKTIKFRTGSLILNDIGQLLPEQLTSGRYNTGASIYPVGYHSTRIYWSVSRMNHRCKYECFIDELDDRPLFKVTCADDGDCRGGKTVFTDRCCDSLWKSILNQIAQCRHEHGLTRLFPLYLSGEQLYGLTEPQIVRVIESLPGVEMIKNYAFKFGKMQLITEMPLAINPTGAARTEPKLRTYVRRWKPSVDGNSGASATGTGGNSTNTTTITTTTANSHNKCGILKAKAAAAIHQSNNSNSINSNIYESANHHVNKTALTQNSKTQQYKRLKLDWMNNVILSRSKIQGLGLFASKDFDKSTMIIEYIGELIRNEVGNRREKLYQARHNSIYMFRLNEDSIIDATVNGGLARYINHSCNPNCVAETLSLDCGTRIIITTRQVIERGDELTYDYKFDFEDNKEERIPCLCGAGNCRKWMN